MRLKIYNLPDANDTPMGTATFATSHVLPAAVSATSYTLFAARITSPLDLCTAQRPQLITSYSFRVATWPAARFTTALRLRGGANPDATAPTSSTNLFASPSDAITQSPHHIIASLRALEPILPDGSNFYNAISLYESALKALQLWDRLNNCPKDNDAVCFALETLMNPQLRTSFRLHGTTKNAMTLYAHMNATYLSTSLSRQLSTLLTTSRFFYDSSASVDDNVTKCSEAAERLRDAFGQQPIHPDTLSTLVFLNSLPDQFHPVCEEMQRDAKRDITTLTLGNALTKLHDMEDQLRNRNSHTTIQSNFARNNKTTSSFTMCNIHKDFKIYSGRVCHKCATCPECHTKGHSSPKYKLCPKYSGDRKANMATTASAEESKQTESKQANLASINNIKLILDSGNSQHLPYIR